MTSGRAPNNAVRWSNAQIVREAEQFVLRIPAMIEERAAEYAGPEISGKILGVEVTIYPGRIERDDRGTRAIEGRIELGTPHLFDLDPQNIREVIDNTVDAAIAAGARDEARDKALAEQFLDGLRRAR